MSENKDNENFKVEDVNMDNIDGEENEFDVLDNTSPDNVSNDPQQNVRSSSDSMTDTSAELEEFDFSNVNTYVKAPDRVDMNGVIVGIKDAKIQHPNLESSNLRLQKTRNNPD